MGFTNVAWESRSTEQLARDLTDGPGPTPVGQAGASWVRVANELAAISEDYLALADRINGAFQGGSADAVARRIGDFGLWLQAMSLSAAGNGERAEEAAVAHGVAILAMPTVTEAVEARTEQDVMASLAAYNGAILTGRFAELDDAATTGQADAAAVMYDYETACAAVATPWDQPIPPDVSKGSALRAEQDARDAAGSSGQSAVGATAAVPPAPLGAFRSAAVKGSAPGKAVSAVSAASFGGGGGTGGMGGMGGGFGPMAAGMARSDGTREHESAHGTEALEGGGEPGAGLSDAAAAWLPATGQSDTPLMVSNVSWGPGTSVLDELAVVAEPEEPSYAEGPPSTLERVSDRWVSPAVIDRDAETAQ